MRTRSFERAAYVSGFLLLGTWLGVTASGRLLAQYAVESFEEKGVDQTGWSAHRIAAYAASRLTPSSSRTGNSAKLAVDIVRQEGGTDKTGETGQDDADLPESRSSDEPPNEKPTTVHL